VILHSQTTKKQLKEKVSAGIRSITGFQ